MATRRTRSSKRRGFLPNRVYALLKWTGLLALPTISWGYQALARTWGLPYASEIPFTLNVLGTAIAVLIGASDLPDQTRR